MKILSLLLTLLLIGCASVPPPKQFEPPETVETDVVGFNDLPAPAGGKVVVAVYSFKDQTGQRKPSDKFSNISFAVTQGAENWVIKALSEIGNGEWFTVVERVALDSLTKERQIIRQARESVNDERKLPPMLFAGVLVEGAITGYDSNILTGGVGARYLGIGPSTQYNQDIVTISMRLISTQTGEILLNVSTTKTIVSTGDHISMFRFIDMGTEALEIEFGNTENEPVNYAVRSAIEKCVLEMVKEGERKGLWHYKPKKGEAS